MFRPHHTGDINTQRINTHFQYIGAFDGEQHSVKKYLMISRFYVLLLPDISK